MLAEYAGLGSALLWAVASVMARAQSRHVDAVTLNLTRSFAASLMFVGAVVVTGRLGEVLLLPLDAMVLMVGAVIVSMVVGDTLFFASMTRLGAARALPISGVYPLFGVLLAAPLAGEPLSWGLLGGSALVVVGVTLVATGAKAEAAPAEPAGASGESAPLSRRVGLIGLAMALAAAFAWALGTVLLKLGAVDMDIVVANSVRLPAGTLVLLLYRQLLVAPRTKLPRPSRRLLIEIGLTGVVATGIGGVLYILSAQTVGAGRTATMGSTAPLFAAPLSAIFLKEPLGPRVLVGSVLSCAGVWLLI